MMNESCRTGPVFLIFLALTIAGCGGDSSSGSGSGSDASDSTPPPPAGVQSLSGQVVNGRLDGAQLEIRSDTNELLATTNTNSEGRFTVEIESDGPYFIMTNGGLLDGTPYTGSLEAACAAEATCNVTPISTAILHLAQAEGLSLGDARAQVRNRIGLQFDPFVADAVSDIQFDLEEVRSFLDAGSQLETWVAQLMLYIDDENESPPPGLNILGPSSDFEVDVACTDLEINIDEPYYLAATHAEVANALTDPDDLADDGTLVIGITGDITTGFNESGEWVYDGINDLVLIGWTEDGSRPVINPGDNSRALRTTQFRDLTLSGLEFSEGSAMGTSGASALRGGAVYSRGPAIIHDTIFRDNRTDGVLFTSGRGGALYTRGTALIAHSEFHDNFSRNQGGALVAEISVSVCHSLFQGNQQATDNTPRGGGAITLRNISGVGDMVIHDSTFIDNEVRGERGGILFIDGVSFFPGGTIGEVIVTESEFIDNRSGSGATAIYSEGITSSGDTPGSADVYIYDSHFEGNSSNDAGPILQANEADVFIFNSTFIDNQTDFPESLIRAAGGSLADTTFENNSNPVLSGDFTDENGNLFLGSSSNPFAPPDGRIVFHRDGAIYTIDPDGENEKLLIETGFQFPTPAWSPSGNQIVYVDGAFAFEDLWRLSVSDQQVHRLTDLADQGIRAFEPTWSVNDEIAYVRRNEGQGSNPYLIYVTDLQGGEGSHLTGNASAADMERYPHWSPDGEVLAFSVREDWSFDPQSAPLRIYTINADGTDRGAVSGFNNGNQPAWSPDGSRLAYVVNGNIRLQEIDGGDVITLAEGDSPTWSPDGVSIAFHHDGNLFLASANDPDTAPALIAEGNQPNWSR